MDGAPGKKWRVGRGLLVAGPLVLAGLVGAVAWLGRAPGFAGPPVPSPNGYDALLAAAKLVAGTPRRRGRADKATDEELRAFVAANGRAVAEVQVGLARESVVPLGRLETLGPHLDEVGLLRQLARVLTCRAVLARREGRASDATAAAVDLLRFARSTTRGGLLLDQMSGVAYRRLAMTELGGPLLPTLAAADARRAIAALESLDGAGEPIGVVVARDRNFSLSREGMMMIRLGYLLNRQTMDGLLLPAIRAAESAEARTRAQAHVLLARLALQAHARDHPDAPRPADLAALVPAYLAAVPRAPDGDRPLTLADLPTEPDPEPDR